MLVVMERLQRTSDPTGSPNNHSMNLQALDENYFRSMGLLFDSSLVGSSRDTDHVHLRSCGVAMADLNIAHLKLPVRDLNGALAEARAFFAERELPFRVSVREDAASAVVEELAPQGFEVVRAVCGMALDPIRHPELEKDALQIRRVETDAEILDFQNTAMVGFGFPVEGGEAFFTKRLFERPEMAAFVGYSDGIPASTALLCVTEDVAGIYFVATLEPFRRKGYGERLTWATVQEGITRGCSVASLQASEMGRPVYARMGFETSGDYLELEVKA